MSAKIAVLGLVIEEPGPAHRLTAKLRQRLSSAGFVDSNVYSALARLERDGFVRAIEQDGEGVVPALEPAWVSPPARRVLPGTHEGAMRSQPPRAALRLAGAAGRRRAGQPGQPSARLAGAQGTGGRADSRAFEATPAGVRHFERWLLSSSTAPPLRDELHLKVALCQPHNLPRLVELVYGQELVCLAHVNELRRAFERARPPAPDRWSGLVMAHIKDAELAFWETRLTWLRGVRESLEGMRVEYERATATTLTGS